MDKKKLAQDWYWNNLTEVAPITLLTEPAKYPPDPRKAFIAGYETGHGAGYEACLQHQEALTKAVEKDLVEQFFVECELLLKEK